MLTDANIPPKALGPPYGDSSGDGKGLEFEESTSSLLVSILESVSRRERETSWSMIEDIAGDTEAL